MKFPPWVHARVNGKQPSEQVVATNRLRYLLLNAAIVKCANGTLKSLADKYGLDYHQMYRFIRKGSFTVRFAQQIEDAVGRDLICAQHLVFPLKIELDAE